MSEHGGLRVGRPKKHDYGRRFKNIKKAQILADVVKETGKLDFLEAHKRYSPNVKKRTKAKARLVMGNEEVMDRMEKILKIRDIDLLKKLKPEVIVQDLLKDLVTLSELVEQNKTDWKAVVQLLTAKGLKQKLIGMAVGLWHAEKPQEREHSAGELMEALRNVGRGVN